MSARPVTLSTLLPEHYVDLDNIRRGHGVLVQRERLKMFLRLKLAEYSLGASRRKVWRLTDLGRDVLSTSPVAGRGVPQSFVPPSGYVAQTKKAVTR